MVTDQQLRRLMMLINNEKTLAMAASKAGMDAEMYGLVCLYLLLFLPAFLWFFVLLP